MQALICNKFVDANDSHLRPRPGRGAVKLLSVKPDGIVLYVLFQYRTNPFPSSGAISLIGDCAQQSGEIESHFSTSK